MPLTHYEKSPYDNELTAKLSGRKAVIDRAAALYHYQRNTPHARLVQAGKYDHRPQIIEKLMTDYVKNQLIPSGFFNDIDLIVPVPLHWTRLLTRGYNQSARLAHAVSVATGIKADDALTARRHISQTRLTSKGRHHSAEGTFHAIPGATKGASHALIIDDIITTGATVTNCAAALTDDNPTLKTSALALCATRIV